MAIGVNQGMPINKVEYLVEDKEGSIWFSHEEGICRLSGDRVYTYVLTDRTMGHTGLEIDDMGRLWIATSRRG